MKKTKTSLIRQTSSFSLIDEDKVPSYSMSPSGGINYTLTSSTDLDWSESTKTYAAINTGISPLGLGIGLPEGKVEMNIQHAKKHVD